MNPLDPKLINALSATDTDKLALIVLFLMIVAIVTIVMALRPVLTQGHKTNELLRQSIEHQTELLAKVATSGMDAHLENAERYKEISRRLEALPEDVRTAIAPSLDRILELVENISKKRGIYL